MSSVTYRALTKQDYERVKIMICDAFGFGVIKDKKFLDSLLTVYLHGCILESSYSRVAVKDHQVIGIILGSAKKDKNRLPKLQSTLVMAVALFKMMIANKENKEIFKGFMKIQAVYKEIIQGKQDSFQGCIELFIVSEGSRGLGVGKTLMKDLTDYMQSMEVDAMYLYTDSNCNYGFYDSQNFQRLNEKELYLESIEENLAIFLYGYNFK